MKLKRLIVLGLIMVFAVALCACVHKEDPPVPPEPTPYEDDFMCGYFLTFYDKNDKDYVSPSSNDFNGNDAVRCYFYRKGNVSYVINGLNVTDRTTALDGVPLDISKSGKVTMHHTLYYTPELIGKTMVLHIVFYNAQSDSIHVEKISDHDVQTISSISFGAPMNGTAVEGDELVDITYMFDGELTFKMIDVLTKMEIAQYDENDELISTDTIETEDITGQYDTVSDCEYIIITKHYVDRDGNVYKQRSLINRQPDATEELMLPYGSGLATFESLKINFA
ncbi:MAG: hypothetical protein J1F36_00275 [Clostridiales bacterium]|nr:hypothetical protein [Clostridiales bacterium]